MTIKNFLSVYSKNFDKKDLEIFLEKILNCDKNFIFLNENFLIPEKKFLELKKFLEERKAGYSVAAIIGKKYFYGREFFVDKNVLIPREETEDLIKYILDKNIFKNLNINNNLNILDIGTGSGIIPITLKLELELKLDNLNLNKNSNFNYYACDISEKALDVAKNNSENLLKNFKGNNEKINFFKSDLLKNIPEKISEKFKKEGIFLITANLPYVEENFKTDSIAKKLGILKEPNLALYSGEDGLDLYRELFEELKNIKFKYLIMEMGSCQTDTIASLYSSIGKTEIYYDLGGNKRGVFVENIG